MSHLSKRISQQELESYLWGAAVLLRGLIDAGDYKQFIFPLLFYKRVSDVWDEEYQAALADSNGDLSYAQFAENHRFQIPEGAHWNDVRQTPKSVGAAIQKAMRAIESANPDMLDGIFGDAPWTNRERLPDETLKNLIEHFSTQTLSVANVPEDELGNAYEYLIKKFADDSGHTAAEFYTNRTVVHLMTQLLAPQAGESIYDPTCGTGGMLAEAQNYLRQHHGAAKLYVYGQDYNKRAFATAAWREWVYPRAQEEKTRKHVGQAALWNGLWRGGSRGAGARRAPDARGAAARVAASTHPDRHPPRALAPDAGRRRGLRRRQVARRPGLALRQRAIQRQGPLAGSEDQLRQAIREAPLSGARCRDAALSSARRKPCPLP